MLRAAGEALYHDYTFFALPKEPMLANSLDLSYASYFALGGFVAGILIVGLRTVNESPDSFVKISNTTAVAAFVGAALFPLITFMNHVVRDTGSQAVYFYPIGLAVAMLWFYGADAQENITKGGRERVLGWIQYALQLILTLAVIVLLVRLTLRA